MDQRSDPSEDHIRRKVAELCTELGARAAGYWRIDPEFRRLIQVAFVPGDGLDPKVARAFAEATRGVSLDQQGLGIVAAARSDQPTVSRVEPLPSESGSGRWLRAFGADMSVAVPVPGTEPSACAILSVALTGTTTDEALVVRRIREAMTPPTGR